MSAPPSDKGTEGREGAGVMGEEEESCPTAAFINMRTCSLRRYSETNRCRPLHINTHMATPTISNINTLSPDFCDVSHLQNVSDRNSQLCKLRMKLTTVDSGNPHLVISLFCG